MCMKQKKSAKIGNQTFLHLDGNTLFLDEEGKSNLFPFSKNLQGKILDFFFNEPKRELRVFTDDGDAIITTLTDRSSNNEKTFSFHYNCISASICHRDVLFITSDYKAKLATFKEIKGEIDGEIKEEFPSIVKPVRFCLLTSQLIALADSSLLYIRKCSVSSSSDVEWKTHKFRDFYVKNLISVNRQMEFGLMTNHNTRICYYSRPQSIFRNWAKSTVCLIQCPCTRHFYAHLDSEGVLRIGDNKEDFALQESNVTGICWEMGVLWARGEDAFWHQVVMSYNEQVIDMRTTKLSEMEAKLNIKDSGQVINILEALKERPALSQEILKVFPSIAQNLTSGIIVNEVKRSLDSYINRSDKIYELLGQIDLALNEQQSTENDQ